GYYNSSTYLGKKKTLGIGFSYDMQDEATWVAGDDPLTYGSTSYALMSADMFLELPSAAGNSLTAEFGWNSLDLDDDPSFMAAQGSGFYGQAGYYLASGFQPWVMYEMWGSDADENGAGQTPGDFTTLRAGVTYYFEGHNANVKLGFESFSPDVPMMAGAEEIDSINTITLGFFTTY
ncbi:MAG: hypothetical protein R6X35_10815, partial [Candidatus Krumholzibacteriia bacterium]